MGQVWAATHQMTNKRVAIKLLKTEVASADTLRRFVREARAASAVRHPNVVEIHDIISLDDGSPALIMDLLDGETLAAYLERVGAVPLPDLAHIMAPVLSAVGTAHSVGIVHRDLKPENIFLARLGDGRVEPKVLDFGIAKLMPTQQTFGDGGARTRTGAVLGTPYYMAPEQAFGEKDLDARADVWALGVILYECSTGKRPIDGENLGQIWKMITAGPTVPIEHVAPGLPPEFVSLVNRMMERDRSLRIRDLREPFELFRMWSGAAAESFGGAAPIMPATGGSITPPSATPPAVSVPSRGQRSPVAGVGVTGVPISSGIPPASRQDWVLPAVIAGAAVAVVVAGISVVVALRSGTPSAAASAPLASASAATPTAAPAPPPAVALPPPATASATPVPPASATGKKPGPKVSQRPAPSSPAVVPAAAPPAAPAGHRVLPGGVHGDVPF